jgi:hypothetical protein
MCLSKLFFIIEEVETFYKKQKLKEFMTTKAVLQKILQGILHTKEDNNATRKIQKRIIPLNE